MGLTGVTLESKSVTGWADRLSSNDARRAVEFATIEINGLPSWISDLATSKPHEVAEVLAKEIVAELNCPEPHSPYFMLDSVARAGDSVAIAIAPILMDLIVARADLPPNALDPMLSVIGRGFPHHKQQVLAFALRRFNELTDCEAMGFYLRTACSINPDAATSALLSKLDTLEETDQTVLVQYFLPHIFGHKFSDNKDRPGHLPFNSLERLVHLAYKTINVSDDNDRVSGKVYSPDHRDRAQDARNAAFQALLATPGRATYDALLRLASTRTFPVTAPRLHELARNRAIEDSDEREWSLEEPYMFETSCERQPVTTNELRRIILERLADLEHELVHGENQQGRTLTGLPDEKAVQNWVADRMQQLARNAYSREREVHVADEKEPDLRFTTKRGDARVPMEIKVTNDLSLRQLEEALTDQLCSQYLRAANEREGILLIVHQHPRAHGWQSADGTFVNFQQMIDHLKGLAETIRAASEQGPQPYIATLDVSCCITGARALSPRSIA